MIIRPENIFLQKNTIKIGDLGLSINLNEVTSSKDRVLKIKSEKEFDNHMKLLEESNVNFNLTQSVGTPLYTAPELQEGLIYNKKVDIYALGLIYFEMLSVFTTNHQRYQMFTQLKCQNQFQEGFSQKFPIESGLILKMIERITAKRLSSKRIIQSEEFKLLEKEFKME